MIVRFKVNLGSIDAGRIGVDATKCRKGAECEVADKAGDWLTRKGIADAVMPKTIKAIPPSPAIAESKPAEVQESKPAPLAARVNKPNHKES